MYMASLFIYNYNQPLPFMKTLKQYIGVLLCLSGSCLYAQDDLSGIGNFYSLIDAHAEAHRDSLSFLSWEWEDTDSWRALARKKLKELLAFDPEPAPLNPEILDTVKRDGYTRYLVRYQLNAWQETEAFLLIPDHLEKPAPAVIALHDHGGFYYFGKEKHTKIDNPPRILADYIGELYEGRPYADALAKRGFVVLCPDAVYFGSQRIAPEKLSPGFAKNYRKGLPEEENEKIRYFNKFAGAHETLMNKTILASGATWLGIIVQGDRKAVDYLLTRAEVNPDKIACMGLSLGGLRSTYLFGTDPRIKTGVISCFSTTFGHMLRNYVRHTWMLYVPQQYRFLDLPDVASLNAPRPLLVQNGLRDKLFNREGMQAAGQKLADIYTRMKAPERFECNFYDKPHSLGIAMQEDAFSWLERWLMDK